MVNYTLNLMSISLRESIIVLNDLEDLDLLEEELNFNLNRLSEIHPEFSYKIVKDVEMKELKVKTLNLKEQKN